jgi:hypothetical protein
MFIASQGMFYLVGLNKALHNVSLSGFIEQRKAIDVVIADPLRFLYFSSAGIAILILAFSFKNPGSITFVTVLLSLICLGADMTLAIKKSIPMNEIINHYPGNGYPDIAKIKNQWLNMINLRGAIAITGLIILLSGFIIQSLPKKTNEATTSNAPSHSNKATSK